ncbi:hypothetical protein QFC21_003120 [Naganishia friedmannii]|uniref:Uncharacterized protein n=1 Tax=Naganishia friedmannii TaxID=89922 RepID=A0ACC2VRN7_9TREE|nr:hypothetical protein QFC21_003120 [Naganishia friedmannii]
MVSNDARQAQRNERGRRVDEEQGSQRGRRDNEEQHTQRGRREDMNRSPIRPNNDLSSLLDRLDPDEVVEILRKHAEERKKNAPARSNPPRADYRSPSRSPLPRNQQRSEGAFVRDDENHVGPSSHAQLQGRRQLDERWVPALTKGSSKGPAASKVKDFTYSLMPPSRKKTTKASKPATRPEGKVGTNDNYVIYIPSTELLLHEMPVFTSTGSNVEYRNENERRWLVRQGYMKQILWFSDMTPEEIEVAVRDAFEDNEPDDQPDEGFVFAKYGSNKKSSGAASRLWPDVLTLPKLDSFLKLKNFFNGCKYVFIFDDHYKNLTDQPLARQQYEVRWLEIWEREKRRIEQRAYGEDAEAVLETEGTDVFVHRAIPMKCPGCHRHYSGSQIVAHKRKCKVLKEKHLDQFEISSDDNKGSGPAAKPAKSSFKASKMDRNTSQSAIKVKRELSSSPYEYDDEISFVKTSIRSVNTSSASANFNSATTTKALPPHKRKKMQEFEDAEIGENLPALSPDELQQLDALEQYYNDQALLQDATKKANTEKKKTNAEKKVESEGSELSALDEEVEKMINEARGKAKAKYGKKRVSE